MTAASTARPGATRYHALDGLRACAATMIVVFHLGLTNLITVAVHGGPSVSRFMHDLGASGVELFFTLSAVVLLRPYLLNLRRMVVREYMVRRLRRLWPPFIGAWLFAGATVWLLQAFPTWWPSAMPDFAWFEWGSQAFIVYFGTNAYNFAWWTLTIEVMFYIVAPLLVLLLAGRGTVTLLTAFIGSIALSEFAALLSATSLVESLLLRFVTFSSCFLGGMLLATTPVSGASRRALATLGICFVVCGAVNPHVNGHVGYGLIYMAVVSAALDDSTRVSRWLARPGMVWLGERSYSLFLTHFSVIALACWSTSMLISGKTMLFFLISRSVAIAGALAVACVLFETIESRFANGLVTVGQWWPRRRLEKTSALT